MAKGTAKLRWRVGRAAAAGEYRRPTWQSSPGTAEPSGNATVCWWRASWRARCRDDWHAGFGGRLGETGSSKGEHRAPGRPCNRYRPHRALGLAAPDPRAGLEVVGKDRQGRVRRCDLLGGLLHEYQRAA